VAKPLTFDLLAHDAFRPGDLGWLTPTGVVQAGNYGRNPSDGTLPVRAVSHIPAGRRGRFIEASQRADAH
jgi:hypothetical protein